MVTVTELKRIEIFDLKGKKNISLLNVLQVHEKSYVQNSWT